MKFLEKRPEMIVFVKFLSLMLLAILLGCASQKKASESVYMCPKVVVHSSEKFKLSEVESNLICGDEDSEAYKVIPSYQAEFLLRGYFQNLGYSNTRFEFQKDVLHVYPNGKNLISSIKVLSTNARINEDVAKEIDRKFKKEIITPGVLNSIESMSKSYLRDQSYACVNVTSVADPETGLVTISLIHLDPYLFGEVKREEVEGVYEEALMRYYPFTADESFKAFKLSLTEKRLLRDGIVQGTYFQESCLNEKHNFSLAQHFITGTSKTIRFGVGASTEVGPMIRLKWSNDRYGSMASRLEAILELSFRKQLLSLLSNHFHWRSKPRLSLKTTVDLQRDDQETYEELSFKVRPHLEYRHDSDRRFWLWSSGPTFILGNYKTNNDEAPEMNVSTGAIEGNLNVKSHDYEAYDIHPESGDNSSFAFDFRHPSFGFIDPLLKLEASSLKLFKIGQIDKGDAIVGIKVFGATTWVPESIMLDSLPPSVKFYGGGSNDIRGFKLDTLPEGDGLGALSKLGFKLEFRKTYFIKSTIEAFAFVDGAYFGYKSWDLTGKLWYSPGLGLRWLSPIGIVQGYWSRSLATREVHDNGNYFYLGLGGVF